MRLFALALASAIGGSVAASSSIAVGIERAVATGTPALYATPVAISKAAISAIPETGSFVLAGVALAAVGGVYTLRRMKLLA